MSAASPRQTVFSLNYDFHLRAGDNGNVLGVTNYKDSTRSQTFTYDSLNRLTSAQNSGTNCSATTANGKSEYWGNTYTYDPWGNLTDKTKTKCGAEDIHFNTDGQNRLHVKVGADYQYDAAGNMTYDANAALNYSYDAENRISGAAGYSYIYDDDGNRVAKMAGDTGTLYWYMSPGIVAESDLSGNLTAEYVFFNGERVARRDFPGGKVSYYFSDHLKTTDIVTDAQGNIKNESDFYPWGGELQFSNNDSNHYKFTGKERDSETGLDYFGARYYSNGLGRFVTPDWAAKATAVPYAEFADPQSLNLYSYVRNVPATRFDADGHCQGPQSSCLAMEPQTQTITPSIPERPDPVETLTGAGKQLLNILVKTASLLSAGKVTGGFPLTNTDQLFGANAMNALLAATPMAEEALAPRIASGIGELGSGLRATSAFGRAVTPGDGSFSIIDWTGYPSEMPKPTGPFRVISGSEYATARRAADAANQTLRQEIGIVGDKSFQVHEVQPVKFAGGPTDSANKIVVPTTTHHQLNAFWSSLLRWAVGP